MGKQATEMLKGTLEGIVLGILSGRSAYGYEITAWLREQGFTDIAEGTIYALLLRIEQRGYVDVTKEPSEKGPPRKVYTLNATGERTLDEFWTNWSFLAERIDQLRTRVGALSADSALKEGPRKENRRIEGEPS
jgi:PadR family transcriptional regulator PadR